MGPVGIYVTFPLPLCARCIAHYSPLDPRAGDPLAISDEAA